MGGGGTDSPHSPAVLAVQRTVQHGDPAAWTYQEGPLENGTAVLAGSGAAYWVKDGVVYAGNGTAKTLSPSLEYAPGGIDRGTISQSVR